MEMGKKVTVEVILNLGSVMLGDEIPLIEGQSMLATLGRKNNIISGMGITVTMGR